jgi:hypothetical protein
MSAGRCYLVSDAEAAIIVNSLLSVLVPMAFILSVYRDARQWHDNISECIKAVRRGEPEIRYRATNGIILTNYGQSTIYFNY